jgi:hypothetical protein
VDCLSRDNGTFFAAGTIDEYLLSLVLAFPVQEFPYSGLINDLDDGCQPAFVRSRSNMYDSANFDQLPASGFDIDAGHIGIVCVVVSG